MKQTIGIFEVPAITEKWVIELPEIINISESEIKVTCKMLFLLYFKMLSVNSVSFQYKSNSVSRGAQVVPVGVLIVY